MLNKYFIKNISLYIPLLLGSALFFSVNTNAQTPVTLYNNFYGTVNYTTIGGSLRDSGNTFNPMSLRATDTSKLNYPSGVSVIGAYMYWAGSDSIADNSVTLDGNTITATRTFTESYNNGGMLYFFGGFADVTSYVQSQGNNHTYTFGGLTVNTTGLYASSQAAIAGWAIVVIYNNPTEVKKSVNIYDGFKIFRGAQITFNPNNFYVPYALVQGKMTHITWEGDKENSTIFGGFNEEVRFNGTSLTDGNNPVNNQFGSLSNNFPVDSTFGVDIDTYDITPYLLPADTQATSIYSSGGDLVILNVEVISIADTANSDIQVTKTHAGGSIVAGNNVTYTLAVLNNGPDTTGTITLYDSLRTGLTFVSFTGSGWTIDSTATPKYKWTHTGIHPPGGSIPAVTVTAYLTAANYPSKQLNSAYATSPQFDRKPWNNASTDSFTILTPYFLTSTKSLTDLNGGSVRPGDTLQYTVTVTNTGNYTASNIAVTDSTPLGVAVVSGSLSPSGSIGGVAGSGQIITFSTTSTLIVGNNTTYQYRVVVDSTVLHGATYTNVAHVRAQTIDQRVTSSFIPVNVPKMQIQKFRYASGTGNGDTILYYMVVKNTSSFATSANTQVVDTIPNPNGTNANNPFYIASGTSPAATIASFGTVGNEDTSLTWNIGTKGPGSVDTIKFKMRISSGLTNGTNISNIARVLNSAGSRDSSTLVFTKTAPVVTISKYQYPPGSGTGNGDTVQYNIVITNTSSSAYSTNTQVIDTLPEPSATITQNPFYISATGATITQGPNTGDRDTIFTWTVANLAPGEVRTFQLKMRISSTLANTTVVNNKATVINTQGWRDSSTFAFTKSNFYSAKLYGTRYILPGDSIYYSLYEADTNKNVSTIESLTLRDTNRVATTDNEGIVVTETAANTGLFTGKIRTVYGTSGYTANNNVFIVKPGDSVRISYIDKYDSTSTSLTTAQIKNVWRYYVTKVLNGHAVALSGTATILPTNIVYYTVNDSDLNRSSTTIETYTIRDSNQVTGEIENLIFTETGVNTGIFTSQVTTIFGTASNGNNNGTFAVQKGDTLTLKYYDSVIVNGSNGGLMTWKTYVAGGTTASLAATSQIYPTDSVLITVTDADLNKSASVIESYTVRDSNIVTAEVETFTVTETGVNTGVFTKKLPTLFNLSAGVSNDGFFNVKAGDTLRVSYRDTLLTNGGPGGIITASTGVRGGATATLTATTPIIPTDSILITVTDADLNKNVSVAETYSIKDSSIATGEVEIFTVTETGINTGIFTKKLATVFGLTAGTNNNGIFNVKAGDSLLVTYRDTLLTNGGPGTVMNAYTRVIGGTTATLTATSPIFPTDSILITITDADLNKSASVAETYSIRDSSIATSEIETFTITETGINTGIFTKKLATIFGLTAGTNNDGVFNVKTGDTLRVTYRDTILTNGSSAILTANTRVNGGNTGSLSVMTPILPGDSVLITIIDRDLNKNVSSIETYTVKDSNIVNGEVETFTITEAGINDSTFTKKLATIFGLTAGTNNDGTFNVKAGDSLRVTYRDTLLTNGSSVLLTATTRVNGGNTGSISVTSPIVPGDSVLITIIDRDLNKNVALIETYSAKDSNIVTGEVEIFTITEAGINDSTFTKKLATVFGLTGGTNNNGIFNVKASDSLRISYKDTLAANGGPGSTYTTSTRVNGGTTATITATNPIFPGDSVLVTITDADLNKNVSAIETYTIKDSSKTGETENWVFTETGINTGIFTKKYPTVFGTSVGTTNNGIFTVQSGDTLFNKYRDTLQTNGGSANLQAVTRVNGGTTATITATNPIFPGDSVLVTITDADLNKNVSAIETYTIKDSSKTGETENWVFTETGINTGIFTKKYPTVFGTSVGTTNNGIFTVQSGDTLFNKYRDTLQTNGGSANLQAVTRVNGGTTATIIATNPIFPGDSVLVTITDADLNKNVSAIETYTIKDSSKSTETENWVFTETGVNTGIFTKKYPTVFGTSIGTTNNGIFTVQSGDTLYHKYRDTMQTNGGSANLQVVTRVNGGVTATVGVNPAIIAANDSSTFTITDGDLNKNVSAIESYLITVLSSTGESENLTFTETGITTGIFTKKVPTIYGTTPGTNNTGVFTVQPADTITLSYKDTLMTNGGTQILSTFFRIGNVNFSTSAKSLIDGNGGFVKPPDTLAYTLRVKNTGTVTATNVSVKDTLPTDLTILTGTITGGGTAAGRVISWPIFTIAVGDSMIYQYSVRVDSTITSQVASINKATIDGNGIRYQVTASFTPVNRPVMIMTKSVNRATAKPGDTLIYTMNYSNGGTVPAALVTITDPDPSNTTYLSNSVTINAVAKTDAADADEVTRSGFSIQLNIGVVQPGQSGVVSFKVKVN